MGTFQASSESGAPSIPEASQAYSSSSTRPVQAPPALSPPVPPYVAAPPAPPPVDRTRPAMSSSGAGIRPPVSDSGIPPVVPVPSSSVPVAAGSVPSAFRSEVPAPVRPMNEPSESLRIYLVRPGDTLSSIAAHELGSASMADNIFLLNRDVITDPDHLMVGVKIRLPIRDGGYGYGEASTAAVVSPSASQSGRRPTYGLGRTHIVARGDTLSSIAQRYYGNSSAWRFLYETNKQVLPDPNTLSVGTELTIPPYDN